MSNTGRLDGNRLENELFKKFNNNQSIVTKDETTIKKEYHSFCSGVDILCKTSNKSIYIQCKFSEKSHQVCDINHFILSAKCLQDEFIKTPEYKLLWVCKNKPSAIACKSLEHFNVTIINNADLDTLINSSEKYVLDYLDIANNLIQSSFINTQIDIDKHKHVKHIGTSILIDDNEKKISNWRNANGIGILHTNTKDTIEQLKIWTLT